jgi:hypothetical protein
MLDYRYVPNSVLLVQYSTPAPTMLKTRYWIPTPIGHLFCPLPTPNTMLMSIALFLLHLPTPITTLKPILLHEPAADSMIFLGNPPIHLISTFTPPVIILKLRPSAADPLPTPTTTPPYRVQNVSSPRYLIPSTTPHTIPIRAKTLIAGHQRQVLIQIPSLLSLQTPTIRPVGSSDMTVQVENTHISMSQSRNISDISTREGSLILP